MPTFRVTMHETRVYEYEAASEAAARAVFDEDIPEPPVGSERSVTRTDISVESLDDPFPQVALPEPRTPDPSSDPTLLPPRAL